MSVVVLLHVLLLAWRSVLKAILAVEASVSEQIQC